LFLAPSAHIGSGNIVVVIESRVRLGGLGEASIGAFSFSVASEGLLVFTDLDVSADVKELESLGLTAGLVVGNFEAAGVGSGGVADITVGNLLFDVSFQEGVNTDASED
jgi:hypothetical protein